MIKNLCLEDYHFAIIFIISDIFKTLLWVKKNQENFFNCNLLWRKDFLFLSEISQKAISYFSLNKARFFWIKNFITSIHFKQWLSKYERKNKGDSNKAFLKKMRNETSFHSFVFLNNLSSLKELIAVLFIFQTFFTLWINLSAKTYFFFSFFYLYEKFLFWSTIFYLVVFLSFLKKGFLFDYAMNIACIQKKIGLL